MLNLITDACYPVIRRDGAFCKIALHQITDHYRDNPVVSFQTPRRDFDGALMQLAIGLLQTVMPPKTLKDWPNRFHEPPTPDALKSALAPLAPHFELMGDGPRFMQDLELDEGETESKSINGLMVEAPGGNTLKLNIDHFVKRGGLEQITPFYAALALFSLQTNAPSGGVGYRTSIRGGGPLTTLVLGDTLWETLWTGVMDEKTFLGHQYIDQRHAEPQAYLPWLKPTVVSKKKGSEIQPANHHPLTCYWAMPRRIRLLPPTMEAGRCDLSGEEGTCFFTHFVTSNYGNNYGEGWAHPLSPHYEDKKGQRLCIKGQPDGLGWRHQAGLVFSIQDKKKYPAASVHKWLQKRHKKATPGKTTATTRIWAFGYDMDNAKARSWLDCRMPVVFPADPDRQQDYGSRIIQMVNSAVHVVGMLRKQYVAATVKDGTKPRGSLDFVTDPFWQETERDFHHHTRALADGADDCEQMESWLRCIHNHALRLFDQLTEIRDVAVSNPQRTMEARRDLIKFTSPRGKKLRTTVGLAPITRNKEPHQ